MVIEYMYKKRRFQMITDSFNPKYRLETPENKLNFIGAVIRYFDAFTHNFNDETKSTYIPVSA